MKVRLESTTKVVELIINGHAVPARIWEGITDNGIACHAYITRIAVSYTLEAKEFERDLQEQRRPSALIEAIPTRLVI